MAGLGIRVTGTIRANRTGKCPLMDDKSMKKKERGTYDYRFDKQNEVFLVKWHDNSLVTMGTNFQSFLPLESAKRWCNKENKEIHIPQHQLVMQYNQYMGGVDHLDWLIQKFRTGIRSKKWYFSLFTNCIDTVMVNAWILSNIINDEPSTLLDFRRSVARYYLQLSSHFQPKSGRPK